MVGAAGHPRRLRDARVVLIRGGRAFYRLGRYGNLVIPQLLAHAACDDLTSASWSVATARPPDCSRTRLANTRAIEVLSIEPSTPAATELRVGDLLVAIAKASPSRMSMLSIENSSDARSCSVDAHDPAGGALRAVTVVPTDVP